MHKTIAKRIFIAGWILLSAALTFTAVAQTSIVRGRVASEKGEPLQGVTILVKGAATGTMTGPDGSYSIDVPGASVTLVFRSVGYISQEIKINKGGTMNVQLAESAKSLGEVTVVGYSTQKKYEITSAIAKIKGSDMDEAPFSRIDHAMEGKLAGVQVQEVSGSPGKPLAVRVRGVGSINNSISPLYVIDGFPSTTGLDIINPQDIESIEVLKDAASAAIYGSRGSNGVVLVTTKSGKGGKPSLGFDSYYGLQQRFNRVDVLNRDEYIDFAIEERNNTWMLQGGNASDPNSARTNSAYWLDPLWLSDPKSLPNNDWQSLIDRTAPVQSHQVSASGTSENFKYYLSGNYFNQEGIILGSDYKRLSFRSNIEARLKKIVTIGLNLSGSSIGADDPSADGNQGPVSRSIRVAPTIGLKQQTQSGGYNPYHAAFYLNPIALATEVTNNTKTRDLLANMYASVEIIPNLKFRSTFGSEFFNTLNQYFLPNDINRGAGNIGAVATLNRENYLNENTLTYNYKGDKLSLDGLAGFTYQENTDVTTSLAKSGFPDAQITTLNIGTTLTSGSSASEKWALMSFLGRINASWDNKYLFMASIRRDGSSRFGSDRRWGWFPAVSGGWRISQEKFMKDVRFLDELKLRASYGAAGNDNIGNYAAIGSLQGSNYVLGSGEAVVNGFSPSSFSNHTLGWEKVYTLNLGLDIGLFDNRIYLGADYYNATTKDLLLNVPIPSILGFSSTLMNIGKVRNRGYELELNTVNLNGKLKWTTGFNISHNTNTVLALGPGNAPIYVTNTGFTTITKVGQPIGSYFAFVQDGVFRDQHDFDTHPHYLKQNVGDIKYKDVTGDGVINADDRTILGNNQPKYFWGLQNTFAYSNFDLTMTMDGQWGNKLLNVAIGQAGQSRGNVDGYWRDRWRSPDHPGNGWTPRAAVTANLTTPSSFWLRDASFYRLRTILLGYNFRNLLARKLPGVAGLRIYFSVDNVYMHDHYNKNAQTGNWSNSSTMQGVDYDASYPLARTYTFGINLKF